ncbi:hypothetical protein EAF56_20395 [Vibrio alginolyticus]|uniref:hypothetical protein n=1 Tax=Vibrio alginolyticus TaxID=663 RepID=UPI00124CA6A0|nr:hypothetical protein [Vibrio alginolyticus]EGR1298349.1 hypothetical protein [Vibrio alginolyticus]EMD1213035.1 hypothetical protein [Vibrio alginolyticus]KAB2116630.1 hypothetical protein F6475_00310 [Vibrio alginolyticus]
MPQLIEAGFDMKLTKPSSNKAETAAFLNAKPQDFVLPDFAVPAGYQLVSNAPTKTEEGEVQTICLIYSGGNEAETVYKVKMIVRNEPNAYLPVKNCTQLIVWRQAAGPHGAVLSGFARNVFNFLLRSHNIMITDAQQTADGKRFWLDRMGESFAIGDRGVYYINLNELDNSLTPVIERVQTFDELMEVYVPKGWGADEDHRNMAFIISTQNLS